MREIKFRGLDSLTGKWEYGALVPANKEGQKAIWKINDEGVKQITLIDRHTAGEYTGVKDGCGVEIYEGDIIRITFDKNYSEEEFYLGVVEYMADNDYPAFDLTPWIDCEMNGLCWLRSGSDESVKEYEVIGNIHENPELLEMIGIE